MSAIHPMYLDVPMYLGVARHEISRRLRAADEQSQRHLARHPFAVRRSRPVAARAMCR
jgi:hypothetical protein